MSNSVLSVLVESNNGHFIAQSDIGGRGGFRVGVWLMWVMSFVLFACGLYFVLMNASVSGVESSWCIAVIAGGQVMVTSLVSWQVKEGDRAYAYIRDLVTSEMTPVGGKSSGSFNLWVMSVDMRASTVSLLFFGSLYVIALLYGVFLSDGVQSLMGTDAGFWWLCGLSLQVICFVVCAWLFVRIWSFFMLLHNGDRVRFMESVYGSLQVVFRYEGAELVLPYGRLNGGRLGSARLLDVAPTKGPFPVVVDSYSVASSRDIGYSELSNVRPDGRPVVD